MQLTATLAQPAIAPSAALQLRESLIPILGPKQAAQAAAPAPQAIVAEEPQPSLGAKVLGNVATKQQTYVANQQLLGEVSAMLGARLTQLATGWWAALRGTDESAAGAVERG